MVLTESKNIDSCVDLENSLLSRHQLVFFKSTEKASLGFMSLKVQNKLLRIKFEFSKLANKRLIKCA